MAGLSTDMLRRVDTHRTLALAAETGTRIAALDPDLFKLDSPADAVSAVHAGWEVHRFPGSREVVTVDSPHGWAVQPSGTSLAGQWLRLPGSLRRRALEALMVERTMVFSSLGSWAETALWCSSAQFGPGVWRVLADRLPVAEFETAQFLYLLGGPSALARSVDGASEGVATERVLAPA